MVTLKIGVKDFQTRGVIFYVISRVRDLGEFVPVFTSEK